MPAAAWWAWRGGRYTFCAAGGRRRFGGVSRPSRSPWRTPRRYYVECGLAGLAGWGVFLLAMPNTVGAAFLGALAVASVSAVLSVVRRCPTTVFLICGIIPLVPGGGIFWTAYYLVSNQLRLAATAGFVALKATIAIAGGIIVVGAIVPRLLKRKYQS